MPSGNLPTLLLIDDDVNNIALAIDGGILAVPYQVHHEEGYVRTSLTHSIIGLYELFPARLAPCCRYFCLFSLLVVFSELFENFNLCNWWIRTEWTNKLVLLLWEEEKYSNTGICEILHHDSNTCCLILIFVKRTQTHIMA